MASPPSLPDGETPPAGGEDLRAMIVKYGPALRRYFGKRAAPQDVDDLVQNVFLRMQARSVSEPVDNIERYIFRTAATVLIDEHRQDVLGRKDHDVLTDDIEAGDEFSPERILIGQESLDRLMAAVQMLPPRVGEAFIFHRFEEMTYEAIARRMGITRSGVEKLIMRGLDRLMTSLEPNR